MPHKLIPPGKRGASWYVSGRDESGRFEYSTGQKSRRRAEAWVDNFLLERSRRRVPGAGETVGFSTAATHYKAFKRLSEADQKLVDAVAAHFGETNCRTITHAMLIDASWALKPTQKDATRNRKVIGPAAAVLHYASEQQWCEYQRIRKFEESRVSNREPASDDDLRLLMANVEKVRTNKRGRKKDCNVDYKRLLLAMLYETGLRITDLLMVDWGAIDLNAGRMTVRIAKTDSVASLPLSTPLMASIANLPRKGGRLFPWASRMSVYGWLRPLCKRLGVKYTPHMSRHALATAAGAAQIPDKKAAELGVWRDPRSLHRYQHVRPDAIPGRDASALNGGNPKGTRR